MLNNYFVIGDIHGMYDLLDVLLGEWKVDSEQLIFLGDYIDRGNDSKKVLQTIMRLKDEYGAVLLRGNHEEMLLQWLDQPSSLANYYLSQGGYNTIKSFEIDNGYTYKKQSLMFQAEYPEVVNLINNLPYYYQDSEHIFVHAGIRPHITDLADMNLVDMLWLRNEFIYTEHSISKRVVFGHTPTRLLHSDGSNELWMSNDKTKIGIDGGAVSGGNLIGLRINNNQYESINVLPNKNKKIVQYKDELSIGGIKKC